MLGPLPPSPHTDRPELPRVRLDVRTGSGRSVSYEVGADEFLIGGAGGCDLRLPAPNLPPVICQLTRKADGVRVRRLTPVLPVHLNGEPLPANTPTPINTGDTLALAGVEVLVSVNHTTAPIVSPRFVPVQGTGDRKQETGNRKQRTEDREQGTEDSSAWGSSESLSPVSSPLSSELSPDPCLLSPELVRRSRELDRLTEELEADRVLWYRRRQEIEQELEQKRTALGLVGVRSADLDARERELTRVKDELSSLRERLLKEYQERRDELVEQQEELRIDAELQREQLEEEFARKRAEVEAELAIHEPKLRELREEQARTATGLQELNRQRELFAADREILDRARESFEAGRLAETERLSAWEAAVIAREVEAGRREEQIRTDRAALDSDRLQFQDDLVRLERRTAAVEEQERAAESNKREVELRVEQLKRDAAEWEETLRLAAAEQDRLRSEGERLDRQKADLDAQSATLAERAGQLEAQQAVLAVLRSKLDRTRQDAEREATQLAVARIREDEALAELRTRIREAEELRAELTTVQENTAQERRRLEERDSLLATGLEEIRQQRETLAAEAARLQQRESELDVRSAEFAEQAGTLKGRMGQALDLQARLEADRVAVREREASLTNAEEARQALQEQLRRRAEDLAARAKALDEVARQAASDRAALDAARGAINTDRTAAEEAVGELRKQVEARAAEVERLAAEFAEREQALARQVSRLKNAGAAVAAERKSMAEARTKWEADRTAVVEADRASREELAAFRAQALAEIDELRKQAPELEGQAQGAVERLSAARDMLRGHLTELHDFARLSREDLAAIRTQIRQEADRLREQEEALNRAKAEHRLAVAAFRQQLVEWQGQVGEMKRTLASSESRIDARQAAVAEAAKQVDVTSQQLAEQAEQLRREREAVSVRRTEVERHLGDMREWYRKKLRELAGTNAERGTRNAEPEPGEVPRPRLADTGDEPLTHSALPASHSALAELDPGDRQLGELLRSHGLVDAETLGALWAEAGRQRRTLRQVLLASGAITLYQLALIEAGNLGALVVGRFRVIDRLRVTPREAIYRVFDPTRTGSGAFLLRHLAEAEKHDAVHPDEFRQRFAAARDAAHPNLAAVAEVLEIDGRPAVLQEWPTGLFSADWPAHAAHPGCWVKLVAMAAAGIDVAHRHGLIHGRLTSDSFVLSPEGVLKVTGFGEPPWLAGLPTPSTEPSIAADLRSLGQVVFGWSQLAAKVKKTTKAKPFPEPLLSVIRRLEADPEPPMADTVAADRPYESAAELVADLTRIARDVPLGSDAWEKLLKHVVDNAPDAPAGLKRSA